MLFLTVLTGQDGLFELNSQAESPLPGFPSSNNPLEMIFLREVTARVDLDFHGNSFYRIKFLNGLQGVEVQILHKDTPLADVGGDGAGRDRVLSLRI